MDLHIARLVQLDKLRLASRHAEAESLDACGGKDPDIIVKAASESKGGVIEKLVKVRITRGETLPVIFLDMHGVWGRVLLRRLYSVPV